MAVRRGGLGKGIDTLIPMSSGIGKKTDQNAGKPQEKEVKVVEKIVEKIVEKPADKVFELLKNSTGVELYDDIKNQIYPMANLFVGDELVHVGRVRKDLDNPNALSLWIVADQLMKGAAYNSIDIGLKMIEMGLL